MQPAISILFKPKVALDILDKKEKEEVEVNTKLIFFLVGLISGFRTFTSNLGNVEIIFGPEWLMGLRISFSILSVAFTVVLGQFVLTYIFYFTGKIIKGKGKVSDIRTVIAYALIPNFFQLPVLLLLWFSKNPGIYIGFTYWLIQLFFYGLWFWNLRLLILGFMRFNKFSLIKSILMIAPVILTIIVYNIWPLING